MNRARQTRPNIRSSGNAAPANPSNHPKEKRGKTTPDHSMTKSKENLSMVKKVRHKAKMFSVRSGLDLPFSCWS